MALVQGQDRLAIETEEHQVRLPVTRGAAGRRRSRTLAERAAVGHESGRTQGLAAAAAAFRAALGQEVTPGVVLCAADLGVDEPVDGFVGNDAATGVAGQPPGHLFRRPALLEAAEHLGPQHRISIQFGAPPAPRACLLLRVAGLVPQRAGAIAVQLPSNRRWRAIQTCCDLADRGAGSVASGHVTPLFNGEVRIASFHGNTLSRCCTSSVNLGGPSAMLAPIATRHSVPARIPSAPPRRLSEARVEPPESSQWRVPTRPSSAHASASSRPVRGEPVSCNGGSRSTLVPQPPDIHARRPQSHTWQQACSEPGKAPSVRGGPALSLPSGPGPKPSRGRAARRFPRAQVQLTDRAANGNRSPLARS